MPSLPLDVVRLEGLVAGSRRQVGRTYRPPRHWASGWTLTTTTMSAAGAAPPAKMAERQPAGGCRLAPPEQERRRQGHWAYRGGSIGIGGQAWAILLAGLDPNDEVAGAECWRSRRANLAPLAPSLSYELVSEVRPRTGADRLDGDQ